jgi:protease-4
MRSFFKYLLATVVGILITNALFLLIGISIIAGITKSQKKEVIVEENTILHLKLNKEIQDRANTDPFENFNFREFEVESKLGLNQIIENIEKAKADSNIQGIFLDLSFIPAGYATIEEIRDALKDFKSANKFIVATADFYDQRSYYLASVSDKVFITPTGLMLFSGMRSEIMYFKNALEKLGVEAQIFRKGKYKSAVEPFMADKMSPENREQIKEFLNSMWNHKLNGISDNRETSVDKLNYLADNLLIRSTQSTVEHNLIDSALYRDEVGEYLKEIMQVDDVDDLKFVSLSDYNLVPKERKGKGLAKDKIAVVYASGEITMGSGDDSSVGSKKFSSAIRKARKDDKVKAIVLRINSPGGSALASEIILREVQLASEVKPVVVSMGNLAASGGYYIATHADKIIANPTTITGSIGVFGALLNFEEMFEDKLGITVNTVKTNDYSDLGSPFRSLSPLEQLVIQQSIDSTYATFLGHVSEGRNLTYSFADSIAQGRIWTGKDALSIGLVDTLGGLSLAIEEAKKLAGLDRYRIVELPKVEDPFTQIMQSIQTTVKTSALKNELGPLYPYYESIKHIHTHEIMARMPYNIEIQ